MRGKATEPRPPITGAQTAKALVEAQTQSRRQPGQHARNRMVAILHNAAMDLRDVATEEDPAHPKDKDPSVESPSSQMREQARAIASRIPAA